MKRGLDSKIKYWEGLFIACVFTLFVGLSLYPGGSFLVAIEKRNSGEEHTVSAEIVGEEVEETEEATEEQAIDPIGSILVRVGTQNVRETPNGTILGTIPGDVMYSYYEENGNWVLIDFDGGYGYIYKLYGDRFDVDGVQIATAEPPTPKPEPQPEPQPEPVPQPEPEQVVQEEPAPGPQDPAQAEAELKATLNTFCTQDLCQWVLNQVVTPEMNDYDKVRAVNRYLCEHMEYDLQYYTTRDAIINGRGRCQGYANAFKSIMNQAGVPTDYIRGTTSGSSNGSTHAWNRVLIEGQYYFVDVTWNDVPGTNYDKYLLMSEAEISRNHFATKINPVTE